MTRKAASKKSRKLQQAKKIEDRKPLASLNYTNVQWTYTPQKPDGPPPPPPPAK